jgi:hypothetical protein
MSEKDNEQEQTPHIDPLTIDELITLPEAAKLSGLSHALLKDIAQNGRLRAKKYGRSWVTTLAAIEEYKKSRHRGKRTDLGK